MVSKARAEQLLWTSFGAGAALAVLALAMSGTPAPTPEAPRPVSHRYKLYDVDRFLDLIRDPLLQGSVSERQRQGFTYLLEGWEDAYVNLPTSWLAYILATTLHETNRSMQPVRETPEGADYFYRLYDPCGPNRALALSLGNRSCGDGARFRGRGYVQITGRGNYARFGRRFKMDLEGQPELVRRPEIARQILIQGMIRGSFRDRKLADYLKPDRLDWVGAREIVNGTTDANRSVGLQISADAVQICRALEASKNWRP